MDRGVYGSSERQRQTTTEPEGWNYTEIKVEKSPSIVRFFSALSRFARENESVTERQVNNASGTHIFYRSFGPIV